MADSPQILHNLVRHWWLLVLTAVLGAAGGVLYGEFAPSTYTASAYVLVVPADPQVPTNPIDLSRAYGRIVDQPAVLGAAAERLAVSTDELGEHVQGSTSSESPVVKLHATAGEAQLAADYATAVAERLVAFGNTQTPRTGVVLSVFSAAARPSEASAPQPALAVAIGAATGLLFGGLALLAGAAGAANSKPATEGRPS